jgi:AsmA family protein
MRCKRVLGISLGVTALVVVAITIVLSSYDFNGLKPRVVQAVKDATGRELKLGGDISLKMGLTPSLVVEQVSFQNAAWGSRSELAIVKRAEVQIALLPLLQRSIDVRRLIFEEPDILLETAKSGKSNLSFETEQPILPAQPKDGGAITNAKPVAMTLHDVRIKKGRFSYRDGQSGTIRALALEELTVSATAPGSPIRLALKGAFNEKAIEVSGTLGPLLALTDPAKAWPFQLTGKAGGATLSVTGEVLDALHDRSFTTIIEGQGPSIPEFVKLIDLTGVPEVGPFKVRGTIAGRGSSLAMDRIDFEAGTEDLIKLKFTGAIKDLSNQRGIEIDFEILGKESAKLGQLTGKSLPLRGPFRFSGHAVDSAKMAFKISDLEVALGETDLRGALEVILTGKKPMISGSVSSQKLDLRPLLPKGGSKTSDLGKPPAIKAKSDKVFSSAPVPLDVLGYVDATLQILTHQLMTPNLVLNDLTVNLALQDGALSMKPLKAKIGGGTVDANIDLSAKGKAQGLHAVVKIKGLNLGRLAKDLELTDKLDGALDLDMDIRGAGRSLAELMAGLNGKTVLVMGHGRFDNKYLQVLGADLSATAMRLLNPFSHESKSAEFNCLVSGFDIKDGIAQTTALVFDTSTTSVVGEGNINLKTEQLDISLKPSPKEGVGASGIGRISLSLNELARPLKLGGTLAKPSLTIDPTQAALTIGKTVGSVALFGPVGIAAALASSSKGNENPCLAAIEAAKKGVKSSGAKEEQKGTVDKVTQGAKGAVQGSGDKLKKLFGR